MPEYYNLCKVSLPLTITFKQRPDTGEPFAVQDAECNGVALDESAAQSLYECLIYDLDPHDVEIIEEVKPEMSRQGQDLKNFMINLNKNLYGKGKDE